MVRSLSKSSVARVGRLGAALAFGIWTAAGCDQLTVVEAEDPPVAAGDAAMGRIAFEESCANCHSSGDAIDLAFFSFPDSAVIRRAVAHVDTITADDIAAYVAGLGVSSADRGERLFQPGGVVLLDDVAFAVRLFGGDHWPEDLAAEGLRAIDPLSTPIALEFPLWSFEHDNRDWMPDSPLGPAVTGYREGFVDVLLGRYYETRSANDLILAVAALRTAERNPDNRDAPCVEEPISRLRPIECFDTRRWIATLGAQYMIREGITSPVASTLHDAWWDVGNAVRRTLNRDRVFENGVENWANWMYLGWAFEPGRHASVYLGNALVRLSMPRHATFHALRAMVARAERSPAPYADVRNAAAFAPDDWAVAAVRFGYTELLARLQRGSTPLFDDGEAASFVIQSYRTLERKVGEESAGPLADLRDQILGLL